MGFAALLLFTSAALAPAPDTAQVTNCPWATLGSAATVLGGDPTSIVQLSEKAKGEGSCTFSITDAVSKQTLRVVVGKAAAQNPCPSGSAPLAGVGNGAIMCTMRHGSEEVVEMIVSRVRATHFTVSISIRRKGSKNASVGHYEDGLKMIAEQVAGNLF
jgi:hypothetical protein